MFNAGDKLIVVEDCYSLLRDKNGVKFKEGEIVEFIRVADSYGDSIIIKTLSSFEGRYGIYMIKSKRVKLYKGEEMINKDFQIGDTVKIVRKVETVNGKRSCWVPSMDDYIGSIGVIIDKAPDGYCVRTDFSRWYYPKESLELVAKPSKKDYTKPSTKTSDKEKPTMSYNFTIRNPIQYDEAKIKADLTIKNPLALVKRERKGFIEYVVLVNDDFMAIAKEKGIDPPVNEPGKHYNFQNWVYWAKAVKKAPFKRSCKELIEVTIPHISQED